MDANDGNDNDNESLPIVGYKLCGFLCAVLNLTCSDPSPRLHTRLRTFRDTDSVGFRSDDGSVILSTVNSDHPNGSVFASENAAPSPASNKGKKRGRCGGGNSKTTAAAAATSIARRRRSVGMVNGSVNVVDQIHALESHRCVRVSARLVWNGSGGGGNGVARAVVLVDVYLPVEVWSGWQFPRSGPIAAALFRHLSCDWGQRSSIIASGDFVRDTLGASTGVWDPSDCRVLGCKSHYNVVDSSKKKLYELHEIFKGLPRVSNVDYTDSSRIQPLDQSCGSGIWDLSDDVLIDILSPLGAPELFRIAATCRHLRFLAKSVMPCVMKLKLFPHQKAAVKWMLQREQHSEALPHPLFRAFLTEDGFSFSVNTVSGEIVSDAVPMINDFHGGMFCDEPGLGKTITALSLVLKSQGKFANPPDGAQVTWCTHNGDQRCGYYDHAAGYLTGSNFSLGKSGVEGQKARTISKQPILHASKRSKVIFLNDLCSNNQIDTSVAGCSEPPLRVVRCTRGLNSIKKNLIFSLEEASDVMREAKIGGAKHATVGRRHASRKKNSGISNAVSSNIHLTEDVKVDQFEHNDTWVECDSCHKWRKLQQNRTSDATTAWFCSMNSDPLYQNCSVPEETYDDREPIMHLLGFHAKGTSGGEEKNISFFTSVLKEHHSLINSATKSALSWLIKLSPEKMFDLETIGIRGPFVSKLLEPDEDALGYQKIFKSFGLRKIVERGIIRWCYPPNLHNLAFDSSALRLALCAPLNSIRLYLSKATLVVVPANLVDHWRTQIQRHIMAGQLHVFIWTDQKRPSLHNLAWDYDVVITTFNRLSAEWSPQKKSAMMQVHWLRVILDEGHTLGSSVGLTNKLQMAISLTAANRWILTGTPTPNTPNSQLSHLQPLLKFLHEEAYGQNQKSWEAGILRPFEAEMEEGRSRLFHLLHRCMISARKEDLKNIPPCVKKVMLLDFTAEHARSYNELAVTVRRNILLADWNDPSHVESLLNPKQWKFRSATVKNIRLSCCVAGHIKVTDAGEDIQETMDALVGLDLDPTSEDYALIKYNLQYGGTCVRCHEWCRLPVITPCMHLLCLECVALDSEKCTHTGCGHLYEMETPDSLARPENPNPKWPVPKDLIELQPSYKQDNWNPDWQSTSSSKVAYLISRLKELQVAYIEGCQPKDHGAGANDIQRVTYSWMSNSDKIVDKVLVFSQFLEHIHVIEQQLSIAGIKFARMYSPMYSSYKMKSLAMFQDDPTCLVLLMDGSAALGLDLSFVSYVFLMEPIWDKSMEEQVISRAHRMGATRPIHVETLAMRSTIEEQMLAFLQDADECRRLSTNEFGKVDSEGARTYRSMHEFAETNYLSQLSFIRTNLKS